MKHSFTKLMEILAAGQGLALATIIEAEGSTPQAAGASAVFSRQGLVAGTVGGGTLEARVAAAAARALSDGAARLMSVRLDAEPSDTDGAICGGAVRVLIDPGVEAKRAVFERALDGFHKRRQGVLASVMTTGQGDSVTVERGFLEAGGPPGGRPGLPTGVPDPLAAAGPQVRDSVVQDGRPRLIKKGDRLVFLEPVLPLPRLIIAGAGHIGRAVARLGDLLDFSVTVVDDRPEFANAGNVPEADEIIVAGIGEALRRIEDSPENYFVIVTRGHEKDSEALRAVVARPAAYVGMIGSKTKIELMHCEFLESGWATAEEWGRVRAPIGLDIGSRTVEEIAVSIAAELVLVRSRRKDGGRP